MTPERLVLVDDATGVVVNVITIEDGSQWPPYLGSTLYVDRSAQIGDLFARKDGHDGRQRTLTGKQAHVRK